MFAYDLPTFVSNAGKTQLVLQLSLTVQLPKHLGGLSGAACYISTRGDILTGRIEEISQKHPLLSPELCGIRDIHTVKAPFYVGLQKVLLESVPAIADERAADPSAKPVKLLIIDTVTDIFDHLRDPVYEDKILRARHLRRTSLLLHQLITKYQIAVVVLGSTGNTYPRLDGCDTGPGELRYSDQARWFCRAHTIAGEDAHEAVLGHVWPNQLNARVMMSRTIRTRPRSVLRPHEQDGRAPKRRRLEGDKADGGAASEDESVPFRRFTTVFSSVAPPAFCDYVIFDEGVVGYPPEEQPPSTFIYPRTPTASPPDSSAVPTSHGFSQPQPSPGPSSGSGSQSQPRRYQQSLSYASGSTASPRATQASVPPVSQSVVPSSQPDLDEDWDMYWKDSEGDEHLYASVEDRMGSAASAGGGVTAADATEEAEAGPPVENDADSSSDHYWDDGTDDGLYADI